MSPTQGLRFRSTIGARRSQRHRRLPELEGLEGRVVLSPTTYTVDLTTDNGPTAAGSGSGTTGDLRYVIGQANADPNPDGSIIQFDPTVFATPQTITLSSNLDTLDLAETAGPEVIEGPAAEVSVSGGNAVRVFQMAQNVTASISGLTITEGSNSSADGGGLYNSGTLTLTGCTISANSGYNGGGILNADTLTLADSIVTGNSAGDTSGGILNFAGGTLTVTDSTISGNTAGLDGIGGNGGGIGNGGTLIVTDSTITGNLGTVGGGIGTEGTATIINSTIAGNSAAKGGGIENNGTLTVINSTITGNSVSEGAGGLYATTGETTLDNTIVALDTPGSGSGVTPGEIAGTVSSASAYNLIGTGGSGGLIDGTNGNQVGVADPGLGALASNGGPTQTMALLASSPAVNAGSNALAVDPQGNPLTTDQRGAGFPRIVYGIVDIGAVEFQGEPSFVVTAQPPSGVMAGSGFNLTVTAEDILGNTATSFNGTVTVALANHPGGATLGGTLSVTATNGVATFAGLTLDQAGSGYTLRISASSLGGTTTDAIAVTPLAAVQLAVTSQPPVTSGVGFGFGLAVRAEDVYGNPVSSFDGTVTMALASNPGGATLGGTRSVTATGGVATFAGLTLDQAGSGYTLRASSDGLTAALTDAFTISAGASVYAVDLTSADGTGSGTAGDLVYVINLANTDPNPLGSLIQFDPTVFSSAQTITLSSTLELSETAGPEVIVGPTAGVTLASGNGLEVIQVSKDVTASISGLTITGGTSNYVSGGGLSNSGTLTLTDCTISGNSAQNGGGIYNDGTLTVTDSTIAGNSAYFSGGGIANGGKLTVTNSTFEDNAVTGHPLPPHGTSTNYGGGISNNENGSLAVTDSTFEDNVALDGGGISNDGTLTATGSTIAGNAGGEIDDPFGAATLTNCTISGNSGYGVRSYTGMVTLTDCTISGNAGYGLELGYEGPGTGETAKASLTDTIVAGNTGSGGAPSDIGGPSADEATGAYNLIGPGGSGGIVGGSDGNIVLTSLANLGLAPLADNGGPTQTMALLAGSPAIGAGTPVSGVTTDQRGVARPATYPDIGAFQSQGLASQPVFSGLAAQTITYGTPSLAISGTLAAGSQVPAGGTVAVSLDGVTQDTAIGPDGSFSTTFATAAIPASPMAYTVTYIFAAQGPFLAASGSSGLTVAPALLTITANSLSISYGGAVPTLTASYAGFVDGQTPADLTTTVVLSTSATGDSPAGAYAILASGAGSSNYTIRYVPGTLTIAPPPTPATPQARAAQGFVTTLYRDVLGRGAEPSGLRYWKRQALGHLPSRAIWGLFGRSKERRGLEREGKAPTIPLGAAYNDALRASRRAARQPKVVPAGPRASLKASHARAGTEGELQRAEAPPGGAGRA